MTALPFVTILIAAIISLGISIYFHETDKRNQNIEKLRRYADKRQADIEAAYKTVEDKARFLISDFDSRQAQANAAIKLFKDQNEKFEAKVQTMSQSIDAVHSIENQINGYKKVLEDLNAMTVQVEENLQRLQKENKVVTELGDKLTRQERTVQNIEKKIPAISEEFSAHNAEQLKAVASKLLQEYESYATKVAAEIKKSQADAEHALDSFGQKVQAVYDEAAGRADKLEAAAFAHLSEQAQARSDKYISELNAQTGRLDAELKNQINRIDTELKNQTNRINAELSTQTTRTDSELKAQVTRIDSELKNYVKTVEDKITRSFGELSAQVDSKSAELESAFSTKTQETKKQYQEAEDAAVAGMKTRLSELSEKFTGGIETLSSSLTEKVTKLQEKYNQALDNLGGKNDGVISRFETKFKEDYEKLNSKYTAQIAAINEKNDSGLAQLEDRFALARDEFERKYTEVFDKITQENDARVTEIKAKFDAEYGEISSQYNQMIDLFTNSSSSRLNEIKESFRREFDAMENSYNDKFRQMEAGYNEKLSALDSDYSNKIADFENTYGGQFVNFKADYDSRLASLREEYDAQFNGIKDNYKSEMQKFQDDCGEQIGALKNAYTTKYTQIQDDYTSQFTAIDQKITDFARRLETDLAQCNGQLQDVASATEKSGQETQAAVEHLRSEFESANARADELRPKIDAVLSQINTDITEFQKDATERIDNMNRIISESVRAAVAESEGKHLSVLEGVDEQLNAYKADIEYKLSQLQTSGADVDTLEKSLKAAMQEVQNHTLAEFNKFTGDLQARHQNFSDRIREDTNSIETKMHEMDKGIDALKEMASGNMSRKLQEFEEEFNKSLVVKNSEFDTDLGEWKRDFDAKLAAITDSYEKSRREVESKYLDELRTNVSALETKVTDEYSRLNSTIDSTKDDMETTIETLNKRLNTFSEDAGGKISAISQEAESQLRGEIAKNLGLVQSRLEQTQAELISEVKNFEETIRSQQETTSATIDATLADLNTWKQQIKNQFDDSNVLFAGELETFKDSAQVKITEATQELLKDMDAYVQTVQKQQNDINERLSALQGRAEASARAFEERAREVMTGFEDKYTRMSADSEEKLSGLKKEIEKTSEQALANQRSFQLKIQDDTNEMQSRMSDLQMGLQSIKTNIGVYDKADQMKRELDEKIRQLSDSFGRLEEIEKSAGKYNEQYNKILTLNKDMGNQLAEIETQKTKITTLEQKFGQLLALSNTVDERMKTLNSAGDNITNMEVEVRNYNEKIDNLSAKFERFETKENVLDRVTKDVDIAFENLQKMEQRITDCTRQVTSLPQEIKDVQANVDRLLQNGPKILDAVAKLNNLEDVISETENRIGSLNNAQLGLKKTELDLQQLKKDVDLKFDTLHKITAETVKDQPPADRGLLSPQDRANIHRLKREGWSIPEIAKGLNRTRTEIEMALELPADY